MIIFIMKIGIAAATAFEIQPTIDFLLRSHTQQSKHEFELLITGIGSIASAYQLANFIIKKSPDYMLQAGIGGSFNTTLQLGDTVIIRDDITGDMGVEENNLFRDLFDMGFMEPDAKPYNGGRLINPYIKDWERYGLPIVHGITVNEITTSQQRINLLREKYNCDIESMEGAAFHHVCLQEHIPFLQLRSISNYIGERDKGNWKLKESITNLNQALIKIIQQIP
jgi:futalosine hydrolase